MTIHYYTYDLPDNLDLGQSIAVDTETLGLNLDRDRLCVVQISSGDGDAHIVHFPDADYSGSENLKKILADEDVTKIFHYARFDVAVLMRDLDVDVYPVYCTKIASKLCRTYTDRHGLKELCRELLSIDLNKQMQSSDWGAAELSEDQKAYAASDVLYLHQLKQKLDMMLERENRDVLAEASFEFIGTRAVLDLSGLNDIDIFSHS